MNHDVEVAVVGAGIGGLAAVRALRLLGVDAHVYEAAVALGEVGAGLKLGPNGVKVLRGLGLGAACEENTYAPSARVVLNWDDAVERSRGELGDAFEREYGAPYVTAYRPDLHTLLLGPIPDDAVHLSMQCVDVATTDSTATARFSDGSEISADYVIGADGIRSAVRRAILDDGEPTFAKSVAYRCLIDADHVDSVANGRGNVSLQRSDHSLWYGPGGQVLFYPIGDGSIVNVYAGRFAEDWPGQLSWLEADTDELLAAYLGWNETMLAMLSGADVVTKWGIFDRDPVKSWSSGRVALLGDAAHPTMPNLAQGANMALEDAYVLARALTQSYDEPGRAMAEYEKRRIERTTRITLESRVNFERSMMIPPQGPLDRDWIFRHDVTKE